LQILNVRYNNVVNSISICSDGLTMHHISEIFVSIQTSLCKHACISLLIYWVICTAAELHKTHKIAKVPNAQHINAASKFRLPVFQTTSQ